MANTGLTTWRNRANEKARSEIQDVQERKILIVVAENVAQV